MRFLGFLFLTWIFSNVLALLVFLGFYAVKRTATLATAGEYIGEVVMRSEMEEPVYDLFGVLFYFFLPFLFALSGLNAIFTRYGIEVMKGTNPEGEEFYCVRIVLPGFTSSSEEMEENEKDE